MVRAVRISGIPIIRAASRNTAVPTVAPAARVMSSGGWTRKGARDFMYGDEEEN